MKIDISVSEGAILSKAIECRMEHLKTIRQISIGGNLLKEQQELKLRQKIKSELKELAALHFIFNYMESP